MTRFSVAEAQQRLTDLASHLANVQGWLEDDDPFFSTIEEIVEARHKHLPRVLHENARWANRIEDLKVESWWE